MSDNLRYWNTLGKTDPAHTKGFTRGGGFKGTAVKPIYTEEKMTEQFGPCGIGWGINEPTFTTAPGSEGQLAVYCTVSIWYRENDHQSSPVFGVGGDMVVVKQSSGLRTDDEAFKKAFTDAVGNAMKHIGMSADVHMGQFDDNKYVQERREEEREAKRTEATKAAPSPAQNVTSGIPTKVVEPAVSSVAIGLERELKACMTVPDLDSMKKKPEFRQAWNALNETDRSYLIESMGKHRIAIEPNDHRMAG